MKASEAGELTLASQPREPDVTGCAASTGARLLSERAVCLPAIRSFFVFSGGALATFLLFRQISGGGTTALVSQLTTDGACRYALVSGPSLSHWSTSTLVTAWYVASSISSAIARDAPGGENACRRVSLVLLGSFGVWATLPALAAYDFRLQPWAQPLLVTLMWAAGLATLLGAPVALLACSSRGERRLCARGLVMAATSNWGDMKHCARLVVAVVFLAGLSTPYWASWQWAPAPEACLPWATARWSVSGDPIPPQPQGLRHPFALDPSAPSHVESVIGGATANTSLALSALCMVFISATGLLVDASEEIADRRREVSNAAAASLGQAIAYVSHEARGPLNAAVLSLALLEDEHDQTANDALYEELSVAIHAARRHLDDLLLWERAGSPLPSAAAGGVEHAASGNSGQWSMLEATVVGAMQRDFSSLCERNGIDLQLETVLVGSLPDGSKRGSSRSLALFTSREGEPRPLRRHSSRLSGPKAVAPSPGVESSDQPIAVVSSSSLPTTESGKARASGGAAGPERARGSLATLDSKAQNGPSEHRPDFASAQLEGKPRRAGATASARPALKFPSPSAEPLPPATASPTSHASASVVTAVTSGINGAVTISDVGAPVLARKPSRASLPGLPYLQRSRSMEGIEVYTDCWRLRGVCGNGVSNAVKHARVEGARPRVTVRITLDVTPSAITKHQAPAYSPRRLSRTRGDDSARSQGLSAGDSPAGKDGNFSSRSVGATSWLQSAAPTFARSHRTAPARAILRIEVADNGAGIPQELLESGKLFQPFARLRQGDDSLRMASSGLGLAIVRSIVVGRLRGTVGLRSRENFGTVLFANVPVWCRRRTREFDRSAGTNAGSDDGDRTVLLSGVDSSTVPFWGFASGMSRMSSGNISALASSRDRATSQRLPSSQRHAQTTAAFRSVVGAASQPSRSFPADSVGMSTAATLDSGLQRQPSTSKELAPLEASPDDTAAPRPKAKWSRSTPQTGLPLGSSSSGQARPGPHEPTMLHGILKDSSRSRDDRRARRQQRRKIRAESGAGVLSKHHRLPAACHGTLAYVIDDERVNRTLLAVLLRRWGLVVREFSDGAQAVAALRAALFARAASLRGVLSGRRPPDAPPSPGQAQPPSSTQWAGSRAAPAGAASTSASPAAEDGLPAFMTLDVEMPVLDGRGVLRAMKGMDWAASGTKPPPVVVVTGNARQHDNRELTSLGAQRVLTKPVDPKVLASFLSRALSRPGVAAPGAGGPAT